MTNVVSRLAEAFRKERPLPGSLQTRLEYAKSNLGPLAGALMVGVALEAFCQLGGLARHMTKTGHVTAYKNAIPPSGPSSLRAQAADVAVNTQIDPQRTQAERLT